MTINLDAYNPDPVPQDKALLIRTGGDHVQNTALAPLTQLVAQINIAWVAKTLVHLLGPALVILAGASALSPVILAQAAIGIIAAVPVYFVSKTGYLKAICSAATVIVSGILAWFGPSWGWGDPSWQNWIALVVSALAAAGVLVIPNGVKYSYHLAA